MGNNTASQLPDTHCFVPYLRREDGLNMIIYKELSSLTHDLGFSARALYAASNHTEKHYYKATIPKNNGEVRELCVPDNFIKSIQRSIVKNILVYEEVSPYATAYRYGGSIVKNARPHLGNNIMLKLDIRHFFDNLIYPIIKERVFPKYKYSEANRVLLTSICVYKGVLPQGAPTSPAASNIIMKDFDNIIGKQCEEMGIKYTRYCDDMTFSGDFWPKEIIETVKAELRKMGLFLNSNKTKVVYKGQKKLVTGVVVN